MPEWFSHIEAIQKVSPAIDWMDTWEQIERPWGCDPRIKITNDKPHVTIERVTQDDFRITSNHINLTTEVFEIPVGAKLTIDIPDRPPIYLNELAFGDDY